MKTKAQNEAMLANMQEAVAKEVHLSLQLHIDCKVLKFNGFKGVAEKFEKYGEEVECWTKKLQGLLLDRGQAIQFDAGTITAGSPLEPILANAKSLEQDIVDTFDGKEGFCAQAWDAGDDEVRNLYEHLVKWHREHVAWYEQKLRLLKRPAAELLIGQ